MPTLTGRLLQHERPRSPSAWLRSQAKWTWHRSARSLGSNEEPCPQESRPRSTRCPDGGPVAALVHGERGPLPRSCPKKELVRAPAKPPTARRPRGHSRVARRHRGDGERAWAPLRRPGLHAERTLKFLRRGEPGRQRQSLTQKPRHRLGWSCRVSRASARGRSRISRPRTRRRGRKRGVMPHGTTSRAPPAAHCPGRQRSGGREGHGGEIRMEDRWAVGRRRFHRGRLPGRARPSMRSTLVERCTTTSAGLSPFYLFIIHPSG